jgi:hypothetical protein
VPIPLSWNFIFLLLATKINVPCPCKKSDIIMLPRRPSADHVAVDIPDKPSSQPDEYDNEFFHRVIEDAGRWAFGVICVEVWVLNEARTHLFRPENGWWIDPYARDFGGNSKFDRLTDPTKPGYIEPSPLPPGVGLSGALWAEAQGGNAANRGQSARRGNISRRGSGSIARKASTRAGDFESYDDIGNRNDVLERSVEWREIKALAEDPDQPHNPRLNVLAEIGIGWAAGVPFKVGAIRGLVIYMARNEANVRKLTDSKNEDYLTHATLLIGSAYALRVPRKVVENERKKESKDVMRRVRHKIHAVKAMNKTLDELVHEHEHEHAQRPGSSMMGDISDMIIDAAKENPCKDGFNYVAEKVHVTVRKFFGASVKAPPAFTWEQTAWTVFGTFFTLAILTKFNATLVENFGPAHSIVLG